MLVWLLHSDAIAAANADGVVTMDCLSPKERADIY